MHVLQNEEDVYEYLYEIGTEKREDSLGMVSRASDSLSIGDITVKQSISLLYQHSTGAVVWNVTPKFAEWIRGSPLDKYVRGKTVVELGSGTGALALLLHDHVKKFIVTDQKPLLKLSRKNCSGIENIEICEFDWEIHDFAGTSDEGVVIACDTIYNEYLIEPFLNAIFSVWASSPHITQAIIGIQFRDMLVTEKALNLFVERLQKVECYEICTGFAAFLLKQPTIN